MRTFTKNETFTVNGTEFKFSQESKKNGGETHVFALNMETKQLTQVAISDIDVSVEVVAKQIGVTENDVERLMTMVCSAIEQDNAADALLNLSNTERVEFINAYIQSEVKKFSEFCVTLLTNTEKRHAFDLYLLNQLGE